MERGKNTGSLLSRLKGRILKLLVGLGIPTRTDWEPMYQALKASLYTLKQDPRTSSLIDVYGIELNPLVLRLAKKIARYVYWYRVLRVPPSFPGWVSLPAECVFSSDQGDLYIGLTGLVGPRSIFLSLDTGLDPRSAERHSGEALLRLLEELGERVP